MIETKEHREPSPVFRVPCVPQIITDEAALRNAERFPKWISPFPPNMI